MHKVLRGLGITFHELGHRGREAALDSLEAQRFLREEASTELGHRGRDGALASLEAQGFSREEASTELGHRGRDGTLASLEAQGYTGEGGTRSASTELGRRGGVTYSAIYRISGNCEYAGCTYAINSSGLCVHHCTKKPKKSDKCKVCGWVFKMNEKRVISGTCSACYQKPEVVAARKKATAEKKAAREPCSTLCCYGITDRGRDKCYYCLYPRRV